MKPYFDDGNGTELYHGKCEDVLPAIPDASIGAIVTDPPYEIAFMSRGWDSTGIAYSVPMWRECLRVLKPGAHLLAFGAPRTYHRLACAIEDAGFEIRDSIHWVYGSGFPKGHDVAKAISATETLGGANSVSLRRARMGDDYTPSGQQGNRDGVGHRGESGMALGDDPERFRASPVTETARPWEGWNTALKPAHEPIIVARKPPSATVAANVIEHGTGALNVDACRIPAGREYRDKCASVAGLGSNRNGDTLGEWTGAREDSGHDAGRWPANLLLAHSPQCADLCSPGCPVAEMDRQSGASASASSRRGERRGDVYNGPTCPDTLRGHDDAGGASRFFRTFRYEAKAPASERPRLVDGTAHTTVKPLELMRWLVRLVTPPGGTVLDPFAGSGTTLEACVLEGFHAVGIEREQPFAELCVIRLSKPLQPSLFGDLGGAA